MSFAPDPERDPPAEPPLVIPVDPWAEGNVADIPLAVPVRKPPRPGFWDGTLLTIGYAAVLFGTLIGIVLAAFLGIVVTQGMDALKPQPGAKEGSIGSIPPDLAKVLAWSFPVGYAAGLVYTLVVLRLIVGRGWSREIGLRRVSLPHLALGVVALPGFVVLSDALGRVLFRAFGMEDYLDQSGDLGELFKSFHWSFAVLAIGVGPGIGEELWCRGVLGRGFVGRYGWVVGVALTSLFFGCLHLFPPPYVLLTAVMGVALHFAYATSRSLWVPVTIHLLNNSVAALFAVGALPAEKVDAALQAQPVVANLLAGGLLLSAGAAMWALRGRVVPGPDAPAPQRGVMVPAGATITHQPVTPAGMLAAAAGAVLAVGCSGGLLWLVLG
jgi:membrane protease YdiL (CAAX protease family)